MKKTTTKIMTLDDMKRLLNKNKHTIKYISFPSLDIRYKLPKPIKVPQGLDEPERNWFVLCEMLGLEKETLK